MRRITFLVAAMLSVMVMCAVTAHAVPVTGKVVSPDGKPVAGAKVLIFTDLLSYPPEPTQTLETDAAGAFTADLQRMAQLAPGVGSFGFVTVYVPGFALAGGSIRQQGNVYTLEPAKEVRGSVKDAAGQPVAGAQVMLAGVLLNPESQAKMSYLIVPLALKDKFTAKTGPDGQYVLGGVPSSGKDMVLLDDPRFMGAFAEGGVTVPGLLTARPGATITGRVVHEDGKPAPGIRIGAGFSSGMVVLPVMTAADGTYRVTGVMPSLVSVAATDPTGQWVATPTPPVQAKAGETAQAPDIVLTEGGVVEGTVTSQATGQPVPDAQLIITGPQQTQPGGPIAPARADKQGHFKVHVLPGKNAITVTIAPVGYLRPTKPIDITVNKGETTTVAIPLVKALSVSGVARDENGKAVADAPLKATIKYDPNRGGEYIQPVDTKTDADGKWTLEGLQPGKWTLSSADDWDVTAPAEITVPGNAPVATTLRKLALLTLTGRVITKDGKALAGVKLHANLEIPEGPNSNRMDSQEIVTDAAGRFSVPRLRPDARVTFGTASLPGYKYLSGGKVEVQAKGLVAQDIVLLPLVGKISGTVLDAVGKPAAGARVVSPNGIGDTVAITDAAGRFTLAALPEGNVMLVAATKTAVAEARDVNGKAPVALTLAPFPQQPAGDIKRAYDVLDELWATTETLKNGRESIPVVLAPYDPDLAAKLATRHDGAIEDNILGPIITALAKNDPVRGAAWAPAQIERIKDSYWRFQTRALVGLYVADIKPDLALDLYHQALDIDKERTAQGPKNYQEIVQRATVLSELATKLKLDADAQKMAQVAADAIKALPKDQRQWTLSSLMALNPALAEPMFNELGEDQRKQVLQQAISQRTHYDVAGARTLLTKLLALEKGSTNGAMYSGYAAQSLVQAMAKNDPAGALELARSLPDTDVYNKSAALAMAAPYQPKETALKVIHEAADMASNANGQYDVVFRIASIAYTLDPALGASIFTTAKAHLEQMRGVRDVQENYYESDDGTAAFAYYYSRIDPGESRLLIESDFARMKAKPRPEANQSWQRNNILGNLIAAMAAIDVDRAIEMAWSLPPPDKDDNGYNNPQVEAQKNAAQFLLLSETDRWTRPFRQWDLSSTWD